IQQARLHRLGNRGDSRRTLRRNVAATAITEAMIEAAGTITIDFRVDRRRPLEWFPAQLPGGGTHHIGEAGAAQTRHRIVAGARPLELVATGLQDAVDVTGIAGNPQGVFDAIIEGFKLFIAEGPVLDSRIQWNAMCSVALNGGTDHLEI